MKLFFTTKYDADKYGHFGPYGGRYVPEMLIPALQELTRTYEQAKKDSRFIRKFQQILKDFAGRPTPLVYAQNLSRKLGGAKIYLKNEGANHTGAHKITHCIGQALLAIRMGKKRLIAETGAGQHGLATAAVAAKFDLKCTVYMGEKDVIRQRPNVFWMERMGTEVVSVKFGSQSLKDAVNAALKDWLTNVKDTHYLLGSTVGPHPYPSLNRDFQSIVGLEVKQQLKQKEGRMPDFLIACVGGGSNAMGLFNAFLEIPQVKLIGVEAGGKLSLPKKRQSQKKVNTNRPHYLHAARLLNRRRGVAEGYKSYFLQDGDGNIASTHSVSAGLDYPGIGPQLAYLNDVGRVEFTYATDREAIKAFKLLAKEEGIIPALESAHALAVAVRMAAKLAKNKIIVVNLSGRGDKDIFIVTKALKDKQWQQFLKSVAQGNNNL